MNIFPTKVKEFHLSGNQSETIDRLIRRTEKSENLTSKLTDKSFRGVIDGNRFKIISSLIGLGAFCVMSGEINDDKGFVKVEIHKVFRVLFSVILCLPIVAIISILFRGLEEFHPILILVVVGQILMIRYLFIGVFFHFLSKLSLNRLRDVLDVEWI